MNKLFEAVDRAFEEGNILSEDIEARDWAFNSEDGSDMYISCSINLDGEDYRCIIPCLRDGDKIVPSKSDINFMDSDGDDVSNEVLGYYNTDSIFNSIPKDILNRLNKLNSPKKLTARRDLITKVEELGYKVDDEENIVYKDNHDSKFTEKEWMDLCSNLKQFIPDLIDDTQPNYDNAFCISRKKGGKLYGYRADEWVNKLNEEKSKIFSSHYQALLDYAAIDDTVTYKDGFMEFASNGRNYDRKISQEQKQKILEYVEKDDTSNIKWSTEDRGSTFSVQIEVKGAGWTHLSFDVK